MKIQSQINGLDWQATQTIQESQRQTLASGEARSHGQHLATLLDSIRGDAQMVVFAGRQRNPDRIEEAEKILLKTGECARCQAHYGWDDAVLRSIARTSIDASFANADVKAGLQAKLAAWPGTPQAA